MSIKKNGSIGWVDRQEFYYNTATGKFNPEYNQVELESGSYWIEYHADNNEANYREDGENKTYFLKNLAEARATASK